MVMVCTANDVNTFYLTKILSIIDSVDNVRVNSAVDLLSFEISTFLFKTVL